ncbi:hypothetical protein LINGRAHAP2_LOCUS4861 [Linum grandiflorum]|jgi:hypothetical protein
MLGK